MLQRTVDAELLRFAGSKEKKCLVVRGARQVGKTWSVRNLGNCGKFPSFIEINFLKSPDLKKIFSGNLDVDTLLLNFSLYLPNRAFIPGKTLLFLDEIQECPEAITSLKFWAEDGRFRVIASGSMLGIDYKRPSSYPVGSVRYLDMSSLSFSEFLQAIGVNSQLIDILRDCFHQGNPVPDAIHQQMMKYLKLYIAIGGMPEVVQLYTDTNSFSETDVRQREILQDYRYDIAHYAPPSEKIKAEKCYFSLPEQLDKENHKFQYSIVEPRGTKRKFGSSIDWLENADLVTICPAVTKIEAPLKDFSDSDNFRLYPRDIGLFLSMYDFSIKQKLLTGGSEIGQAKGGIYEALIACMLAQNRHKLYFYKNDTTKLELEFLMDSPDGVIPIEVKAGNNRSRSLDRILQSETIPYGYKLISGNAGMTGKKRSIPLYMAMFL